MDIVIVWAGMVHDAKRKVEAPFAAVAKQASQSMGLLSTSGSRDGIGSLPGSGESALADGSATVPWQAILRRYVGRKLKRHPVFGRPPRRFPNMTGIVPGRGPHCGQARHHGSDRHQWQHE